MIVDNYEFKLDSATKFFNSLYLHGWFNCKNDDLIKINIIFTDASIANRLFSKYKIFNNTKLVLLDKLNPSAIYT